MQKDVIYIDVEDDITAIIGKVNDSKEKVVALVPPKRIGVLQSAVNLRLLARAGSQHRKHVVLITNDQALMGIAASAKIPVAKNLQSKPEIPTIAALVVDDDDDIIDGEQLPVGELARTADTKADGSVPDSAVSDLDIDGDTPKATPPVPGRSPAKPRVKSGVKVPSFSKFRKKVFLIGGGVIALIIFLIWAIWFAPQATVVIDARMTDRALKTSVTIGPDLETDSGDSTIKSISQQEKETVAVEFDATGTEDRGEKATGQVKMSALALAPTSIPAGTTLTSDSGLTFVTNANAVIPAAAFGPGCFPTACASSATVNVTASASGTKFNGASGQLSGAPSGVTAQFNGSSAGGTEKIVKIVTQGDVLKAKEQLEEQTADEIKKKLTAKFGNDVVVIQDSFTKSGGDPQSAPGIGQEATGKAKLTRDTTFTMSGVSKNDMDVYLKTAFENTLNNKEEQRVYDNGLKQIKFSDFKQGERVATMTLDTSGQIGPKIDDAKIKEDIKGKRFGEVQADLKGIDGVNDAETKFWPFWVQTVPNDSAKIKIEFKLKNGSSN